MSTETSTPIQAPVSIPKQLLAQMSPVVIIKLAEALMYLEKALAEEPKPVTQEVTPLPDKQELALSS